MAAGGVAYRRVRRQVAKLLLVDGTGEPVQPGQRVLDNKGQEWEFLEVSVYDGLVHVRDLRGTRAGRQFFTSVFPAYTVAAED
jgi:hypothetical protein